MHECLEIQGGAPLRGTVQVSGAKNSALPLLFATLLSSEECVLHNVPDLSDISKTARLLRSLGASVHYHNNTARVHAAKITGTEAPYSLIKSLRASFWILGPLVARVGEARVALPGGDAIGTRPVDLHLNGLIQMGAEVRMRHGVVIASAPNGLRPATVSLEYPSVGATHNLLMAAARVDGETTIVGAAQEPEVVELAAFLSAMGAEISGAGTEVITIRGTSSPTSAEITVIGDRIEAATYLTAGAMTRGSITVVGIEASALSATLEALRQMGADVSTEGRGVTVSANRRLLAAALETAPFPGLATDVQPILMAALVGAEGVSTVRETVFDNRFGHVAEYRRLGADISIQGPVATIRGVPTLSGAPVEGLDIRAAVGMVLLGLCATGTTLVEDIHHLDRGYDGLVEKLSSLGAKIRRTEAYEDSELVVGC